MSNNNFLKSFSAAVRGLVFAFKSERNFRWQIFFAIITFALSVYFPLKTWEIILVVLLIFLILVMELVNTALEYFTDLLKPRLHHYVRIIKDLMAAAVLLVAICSLIIGSIIFLPHFLNLLK